eukprot:Phypoly_transcript_11349.p1 GENE.Phypoly_transcript_11349~~Phypoly_transcript_11349.p1  ORF type:complete len:381 (+),score=41.16 Phypoly_transcript_11349:57-1145(+)
MKTPREDGFVMPAEWEPHKSTWIVWPERQDIWRDKAVPAQKAFSDVINAIAKYERVNVIASKEQLEICRNTINNSSPNVNIIEMPTDDAWVRDSGPTFVVNRSAGEVRGVKWIFNGWGDKQPHNKDNQVGKNILDIEKTQTYFCDIVMEPGSFHVDGEGTLITTKECLLHPSRNPNLTQSQIEEKLKEYLNVQKVIWLNLGLEGDSDTNGHIDNLCCFLQPGVVALTWTDDVNDGQYKRAMDAYEILENSSDAKGRKIHVVKLHQPAILTVMPDESSGLVGAHLEGREPGSRLPANYTNFYVANQVVVVPAFGDAKYDQLAKEEIGKWFPEREIVLVPARDIVLGGGIIHCITQQQPLGIKK